MIYPTKLVYLAGPITGLSYGEARLGWREEFKSLLPEYILPLSPMRAKGFLKDEKKLDGSPEMYSEHPLARPQGIVTRDRNDVMRCDAFMACFLGSEKASIGTCVEFGWADAYRKPIISVIDDKNIHEHGFLHVLAGYKVPTLEEAAHIVTHLLTPGV